MEARSTIQEIAIEQRRQYGYRRIAAELRRRGRLVIGRKGETLAITSRAEAFSPGDLVAWDLGSGVLHISIIVDRKSPRSGRCLVVHNIGAGPTIEEVLFNWKSTGHYRYFAPSFAEPSLFDRYAVEVVIGVARIHRQRRAEIREQHGVALKGQKDVLLRSGSRHAEGEETETRISKLAARAKEVRRVGNRSQRALCQDRILGVFQGHRAVCTDRERRVAEAGRAGFHVALAG